ncbi:MAG TPA: GNAT family N-acetyltransferase [Pyrinomonadaceae bacterium]|nr:GNAT family N-acetyltransferase [Pyrinomonadaceae bacterium]
MLETERLVLRRFTPDDLDELVALRSDPEVRRYLGDQSRERVEQRLQYYISHYEPHGFGMWAVLLKETGQMIGWCGLMFLDETPEVEVGYGVARDYWGKGLMTEAAHACLRYGFERVGLERIVAVAMPENHASRRIMEKLGMRYEKIVHHYGHDLVYYAIGRDEFKDV